MADLGKRPAMRSWWPPLLALLTFAVWISISKYTAMHTASRAAVRGAQFFALGVLSLTAGVAATRFTSSERYDAATRRWAFGTIALLMLLWLVSLLEVVPPSAG
jgi:hypothetical protein